MFEPIAIVGRGCVLPGAFSAGELWGLVAAGRSLIEDAPADAWPDDPRRFRNADQASAPDDYTTGSRGGFVRGFEATFDATGFQVSRDEVRSLDRTRQWLLDAGRQAVREAGRDDLRGTPAAVVVGNLSYPTATLCELAHEVLIEPRLAPLAKRAANGTAGLTWTDRFCSGRPAHLLAEALGAAGPAFALDAACASSLYAVKLACDYLHDRTVDMAVAGAVNGVDNIFLHLGFSRIKALSPSGMSRPFSRRADGLLPAEGAAALCLKRLADAVAGGDRIFGVIRGIGLANDGRQRGLLVPDPQGQARAIQRAYEAGGIDPATISLMECHATGTPTGDRTEIATLKAVFDRSRDLPVGSLKSNLGHLITVAGLAAVIKMTGALAEGTRPPTLNAEEPLSEFDGSAIRPLHVSEAWPDTGPRRAGVSNFGFGGNNAHLILEEFTGDTRRHAVRLPEAMAAAEIAICSIGAIIGEHRGLQAIGQALRFGVASAMADHVELPLVGLRFPPADLKETLGQHLLLLEAALAAVNSVTPAAAPERAGVFVGMGCDPDSARPGLRWRIRPALKRLGIALEEATVVGLEHGIGGLHGPNYVIGAMPNLPANRINVQFDWRGIGLTVSSEELSGLTALELAVRALKAGELDMALAGAVDLCHEALHRKAVEHTLPAHLHRPADAAIAFVLKRRADAERDGDPVLAIVEVGPSTRNGAAAPLRITAPRHGFGHAHAAAGLVDLLCALLQGPAGADEPTAVERVSFTGQRQSASARRIAWPAAGNGIAAEPKSEKASRSMLTIPAHLVPIAVDLPNAGPRAGSNPAAPSPRPGGARPATQFAAGRPAEPMPMQAPTGPAFGRRELETLAGGRISTIFGPLFEQQDGFRRQCRMPQPPLLLADRVVGIAGAPGSMDKGICWTETDIAPDAWYLQNGRMPTGLLIEAGQADLLLISWLGIDFLNRGERIYRLLGCEITFHDSPMPRAGETIRFQIHIDSHAKFGEQRLFFFRYDARVGDRPISSVRHGQAGFFADAELAKAGGVLWSAEQDPPKADARLDPPPCVTAKRAFSADEVAAFAAGDAFACFGAGFERAAAHQRTPGLPGGRMRLIDRIPEFDPTGGPWGRGYLRAETNVPVDAWFYDGHFLNDPCMPGTLMAEAAVQALQFHMAALGFTIERDGWEFRPVPGEAYKFVCRGQVIPDRPHRVSYEVFIEEVVGGDQPEIYGALLARSDDFKVFLCRRFGVRLVQDWPLYDRAIYRATSDEPRIVSPEGDVRGDYRALLACAWGRPSEAFGSMYAAFDSPRRVPRLPGLPYHFMSRVVSVDCPPGRPTDGGRLVVEYDARPEEWYFAASGNRTMPFAVLVEVLLQGCGWLASYMGFALPGGLKFRNLDGENAVIHAPVTPETGTLTCDVTFVKRATAGPMTIVFYEVVCRAASGPIMTLTTDFGFFPADALVNQKGLPVTPAHRAQLQAPSAVLASTLPDMLRRPVGAGMPRGNLAMVDDVAGYWPEGGRAGLGRATGRQEVKPDSWYFKAHFYEDPVQPGSLGLEALFILLKATAMLKGLHDGIADPVFEAPSRGQPVRWKFRGQVVPTNKLVTTEVEILAVARDGDSVLVTAEGNLWVEALRIYELQNMTLRIRPGDAARPGTGRGERVTIRTIDPQQASWLLDHCPTYVVPVVPMMGIVAELMASPDGDRPGARPVRLENVEVTSWLRLDQGAVELQLQDRPLQDGRTFTQIERRAAAAAEPARIGRAIRSFAPPDAAPPPWPMPEGTAPVDDPYRAGGLFHAGVFQVVDRLMRSPSQSWFELDCGLLRARAGGGITILLDGILHGIPHALPHLWFGEKSAGVSAFPYRLERFDLHRPLPEAGPVLILSRALDMPTARTIRLGVQVQQAGSVILELTLLEALMPMREFSRIPMADRRRFARDRRFTEGWSVAETSGGRSILDVAAIKRLNWLPGTLEAIYGVSGSAREMVEAIALMDHVAARHRVHPSQVQVGPREIKIGDRPVIRRDEIRHGWIDDERFEVRDS